MRPLALQLPPFPTGICRPSRPHSSLTGSSLLLRGVVNKYLDCECLEGGSNRSRRRPERRAGEARRFACRLGFRSSCAGRRGLEAAGLWPCGFSSGFGLHQPPVCPGEGRFFLPFLNLTMVFCSGIVCMHPSNASSCLFVPSWCSQKIEVLRLITTTTSEKARYHRYVHRTTTEQQDASSSVIHCLATLSHKRFTLHGPSARGGGVA